MDTRIVFFTPLSIDECVARITEGIDPMGVAALFGLGGSKPMLGTFSGDGFTLRRRKAGRTVGALFSGTLIAQEAGTIIEGRFEEDLLRRIFMIVWFAGVGLFGGVSLVAGIHAIVSDGVVDRTPYLGIAVPAVLILFGIGLEWLNRRIERDDEIHILSFIEGTLKATKAENEAAYGELQPNSRTQ